MKNILAFFGAFNPPTVAHISLAEYACEKIGACGVMFVPSKASYIRYAQGKDFAYSDSDRLEMLRAVANCREKIFVTDCEIKEESQPRTYHTLCRIRENGYAPRLLLGSDKLPELESGWRFVKEIAKEFGIVCLSRGGDDCEKIIDGGDFLRTLKPYITVIKTPDDMHFVSSTTVRKLISDGETEKARTLLPREVFSLAIKGVENEI